MVGRIKFSFRISVAYAILLSCPCSSCRPAASGLCQWEKSPVDVEDHQQHHPGQWQLAMRSLQVQLDVTVAVTA